jgi:hypothetical protein
MKTLIGCAALALALAASPANAKGCLKGAVVGGTAGHFLGTTGSSELRRVASSDGTRLTNALGCKIRRTEPIANGALTRIASK